MIEKIQERAQLIQKELQKITDNVRDLTEKLEQEKVKLSQLTGHYNEINFILNEMQQGACQEQNEDIK
jgi:DNA anti-recombination protein RmuC